MDRMVEELVKPSPSFIKGEPATVPTAPQPSVDVFRENPVDIPVEKPRRERTEKQKANDEKLRVAALAKKKPPEPVKAAPAAKKAAPKPPPPPVEEEEDDEEEIDPKDLVELRLRP